MRDKYFLDTNIIVYSFGPKNSIQRERSRELINEALSLENGCISYQVLQEFINVSTKKFKIPITPTDLNKYLSEVLFPLCEIHSSADLYTDAVEIMDRWKFGFYDSLILASAILTDCKILYSEDLQDGQKIQGLTVINPFTL